MRRPRISPYFQHPKYSSVFFATLGILSALISSMAAAPVSESAMPQELLAVFPKPPPHWKMVSSIARKDLTGGEKPTTTATRIYEIAEREKEPPRSLMIEAVDLIARTDLLDYLRDASPTSSTGASPFQVGRFLGRIRQTNPNSLRMQALVGGRVTVRVETKDISSEDFIRLLKQLDWDEMVADTAELPQRVNSKNEFIVGVFYELDPKLTQATVIPVYVPPSKAPPQLAEDLPVPPQPQGP